MFFLILISNSQTKMSQNNVAAKSFSTDFLCDLIVNDTLMIIGQTIQATFPKNMLLIEFCCTTELMKDLMRLQTVLLIPVFKGNFLCEPFCKVIKITDRTRSFH